MRTRLDDRTADRLLAGAVTSEDAPPGYAGAARLLHAARTGPVEGTDREAATVASMRAAVLGQPTPFATPRRKKMLTSLLTAKAGAAAAALVLVGGTAAAAATDTLPQPAQKAVSSALSDVGISVPNGSGSTPSTSQTDQTDQTDQTNQTNSGTATNAGKPAGSSTNTPNSHATFGLCTAQAAHTANGAQPKSSVFTGLNCTGVTHPGNGQGKPASVGSQGQGNKPSTTASSSNAPVGTPNDGSAADTAGSGTPGAGHAPATTPAGGASTTGSANSQAGQHGRP